MAYKTTRTVWVRPFSEIGESEIEPLQFRAGPVRKDGRVFVLTSPGAGLGEFYYSHGVFETREDCLRSMLLSAKLSASASKASAVRARYERRAAKIREMIYEAAAV